MRKARSFKNRCIEEGCSVPVKTPTARCHEHRLEWLRLQHRVASAARRMKDKASWRGRLALRLHRLAARIEGGWT